MKLLRSQFTNSQNINNSKQKLCAHKFESFFLAILSIFFSIFCGIIFLDSFDQRFVDRTDDDKEKQKPKRSGSNDEQNNRKTTIFENIIKMDFYFSWILILFMDSLFLSMIARFQCPISVSNFCPNKK